VTAQSAGLGRGSAFSLTLPTAPPGATSTAGRAEGLRLPATSSALHVLLVDDNADAAAMLALIVEAAGHDVTVEHTAQGALRQADRRTFDACLLDIGLPDINGNELARRLRTLPGTQDALLVAVTGYGQPSDRHESGQAGFDHHMVKPVDSAQLLELLAALRVA